LREHGLVLPVGARKLRERVVALLDQHAPALPGLVTHMIGWLLEELVAIEQRLRDVDRDLHQLAQHHPVAVRLQEIPGVGPLTATALIGSVPHIHAFTRGRQFASWLGLTPRESSSGRRRTLGGISKRGDRYLRSLLAHGARSVLRAAVVRARSPQRLTRLHQWGLRLRERRGQNRAVIAVANKLARIIWAVWSRDLAFT
jgi:transposase